MNENEIAFRTTFQQTLARAKRLVTNCLPTSNTGLRRLVAFALHNQMPSGSSFVLKYTFCHRERDSQKILNVAAALLLLQESLLITDDIFDSGKLRHGACPVYLRYGVNHAVIAAELLQTIALRQVSEEAGQNCFHNPEIACRLLNEILLDCYTGQFLDLINTSRTTVTLRGYYRMIALGSGRVFQKVARCGAMLAGKSAEEIHILEQFAYAYGMALFIIDDTIDLLPARATGKTYASDLQARRMRLPIILALRFANRNQRKLLDHFLRERTSRAASVAQVARIIRECRALQASLRIANRYVTRALDTLAKLPPSLTTRRLGWLAERLLVKI